jgi:hypothetical protein
MHTFEKSRGWGCSKFMPIFFGQNLKVGCTILEFIAFLFASFLKFCLGESYVIPFIPLPLCLFMLWLVKNFEFESVFGVFGVFNNESTPSVVIQNYNGIRHSEIYFFEQNISKFVLGL